MPSLWTPRLRRDRSPTTALRPPARPAGLGGDDRLAEGIYVTNAKQSESTPGELVVSVLGDLQRPAAFQPQMGAEKVPTMDSTEFHAMFHEAAARGWDEQELRELARMWAEDGRDEAVAAP